MSTVLVSAFVLQGDGTASHPPEFYLRHFDTLAQTGLPIVFFLDESLVERVSYPPNVRVEPATLRDCWMHGLGTEFPKQAVAVRDTPDYMRIQNSKTQFCARVADEGKHDRVAWVDTAITQHFEDPAHALRHLMFLDQTPAGVITLPGCWLRGTALSVEYIVWRFAGSFFVGDSEAILAFDRAAQAEARSLLPHLTWEINVWAYLEEHGFPFRWYPAAPTERQVGLLDWRERNLPTSLAPVWQRMGWKIEDWKERPT